MNINDKIKQILIDKNLTPSYFADEIGVQRSSISHILSGRNRPSFDIIQKIIRRFPELGYEWIMEEDSQQHNQLGQVTYVSSRNNVQPASVDRRERFTNQPSVSTSVTPSIPMSPRNQRDEIPAVVQQPLGSSADVSADVDGDKSLGISTEKKIERILIFYTDGSFRDYRPSI